ncbi:tetratricopeptide repeat protein [Sphingomonas sp.]|uniref:tetratricopeptide repeat protein n=1 Tax=Sphingomonas sp. TaxID=28214 RepID=UPI00325FA76A
MAIAPDPSESFAREVNENLRRDRVRDTARAYGKWVIAGVILLLIAIGAFLAWRDYQAKQAAADSEALALAIDDIGNGNVGAVRSRLAPLKDARGDAISVSAKLADAAFALQQNDRPKALAGYKTVAEDSGIAQPWRDLATVRQTALEYDALQPQAVIDRLAPLAKPGNPWFGSAGEMTALALLKAGRKSEAGRLFAAIAGDKAVPDSIRGRAVQMAGSLGVDASASLPTP